MKITHVELHPAYESDRKLIAFATITFDDCFVVRDIKIIEGEGSLFVAMPSRKKKDNCPVCMANNYCDQKFCGSCGRRLNPEDNFVDPEVAAARRRDLHRDIAHPITKDCRALVQKTILEELKFFRPALKTALLARSRDSERVGTESKR